MNITEQEIVKQLKLGEEKAFRYLFDHHYTLLCHIAVEFLKDDFLAETVVGDVIFHLWEKRETIDIQTSIRAYLVQSVRYRCINYLQQEYVIKETRFAKGDELIQADELLSVSENYPLATLLEKELEQEIKRSIAGLPDECRIVFEKSRFENLKYQEIASLLDISVNTVKYHIKNAISKLNTDLSKYLVAFLSFCILS
jgi:RNA polymerase sigma-70 factor (ECF subfamily)